MPASHPFCQSGSGGMYGTMLLDEVGDLPAQTEAKLLRVLQEREMQRVGATRPVPINVRVIAATNRDLEACIESGTFRPGLFYRLSVFPIHLPALRDRREDIPVLATHFLQVFSRQQHKAVPELAPGVLDQLVGYDWPGNIASCRTSSSAPSSWQRDRSSPAI